MSNNNPAGINGYGPKNYPPDDVLKAELLQYAKEGLTIVKRLECLKTTHDLIIGKSHLAELDKKFNIPTTQAILEIVASDHVQSKGIKSIKGDLANEGILIPQNFIHDVLVLHALEGLMLCFPGIKQIPHTPLATIGPNHQHYANRYEKLNAQALGMGGVKLDIYGIKDQWSSFILHLVVIPNSHLKTTAAHTFLDSVEKHGFVPVTFVTDKGSETGLMYSLQQGLHEAYAPDIDPTIFPSFLHLKSVHNTPIESLWNFMRKHTGMNFREEVQRGYMDSTFKLTILLHVLQAHLDKFVDWWNNHKIQLQKEKVNMSAPPAEDCHIHVDKYEIHVSHQEAMQWVDDKFDVQAQRAYAAIGSPSLSSVKHGWEIFSQMEQWMLLNV
ncbi:hypothetical protein P691DRAFT_797692 [Macrolepiota fuliginosa MF-IS2]|uniref:Integrase core domain-containing protein n=1 Tax=Macrolepiota fuliginosa MF-IS2 TaxID=1400762 RepID=A0A9P5X1U6_9AGAR|nr:hypothetical protein P691DRAFT_797692 [Macrolepiota fuliginosa MF-IS2]